ncbi:MAG: AMP-binding protein [Pseudonocardiales bacterium]
MNYRAVADGSAAVAAALAELDVRPGERVLIMLPDGPGFVDVFVGAIRQGAVPLDGPHELGAASLRPS